MYGYTEILKEVQAHRDFYHRVSQERLELILRKKQDIRDLQHELDKWRAAHPATDQLIKVEKDRAAQLEQEVASLKKDVAARNKECERLFAELFDTTNALQTLKSNKKSVGAASTNKNQRHDSHLMLGEECWDRLTGDGPWLYLGESRIYKGGRYDSRTLAELANPLTLTSVPPEESTVLCNGLLISILSALIFILVIVLS